jgi:lipopolysaccharide export LptBFGC system permease protein LptF
VPIGLAIGIAFGAYRRPLSRRLIGTIILVALGTSVVSAINVGWLNPATNQLFREAIVGEFVIKGDREFTLPQLNRLAQAVVRSNPGFSADRYRSFVFEFHHRLAFAIAPLTFCAFALVLTHRRRAKPLTSLMAVSLTGVGYLMLRWLGNALSVNESVSPQLGAWMPQITLVLTTIVLGVPTTLIRRRA